MKKTTGVNLWNTHTYTQNNNINLKELYEKMYVKV